MTQPQAPIPVVAYALPAQDVRPGILTAVGIISIVMAILSALASIGGILSSVMFLFLSNITIPAPPPPPTLTGANPNPAMISDEGLFEFQRRLVISVLSIERPLDEQQEKQLDALLAQSGRRMFPTYDEHTTRDDVRTMVTASYTVEPDEVRYIISTGRIEVSPVHASFFPTGSAEPITRFETPTTTNFTPAPVATQVVAFTPFAFRFSTAGLTITIAEAILSLALAIFLLIAGILLLRDSPRAIRYHWRYVWIKIPLAILASVGGYLVTSSMFQSVMANTPPGTPPPTAAFMDVMVLMQVVLGALLSLAYPVALIFVLSSNRVKAWASSLR